MTVSGHFLAYVFSDCRFGCFSHFDPSDDHPNSPLGFAFIIFVLHFAFTHVFSRPTSNSP